MTFLKPNYENFIYNFIVLEIILSTFMAKVNQTYKWFIHFLE
jgi:hypothetical protein